MQFLGADYTMNTMSGTYDLLPFESGVEQGIYTAIFAEYMAMLQMVWPDPVRTVLET